MKKIILLLLTFFALNIRAQNFVSDYCVVPFAGTYEQGSSQWGTWFGAYGSARHGLNEKNKIGIFVQFVKSEFANNKEYESSTKEYTIGLLYSYWQRSVFCGYNLYFDSNIGIEYYSDEGHDVQYYHTKQIGNSIATGLNVNLYKHDKVLLSWFNRTQIEIAWKYNFRTQKRSTWKNLPTDDQAWDRGLVKVTARENIFSLPLNKRLNFSPKLILAYEFREGDKKNFYSSGLGLGLHKQDSDDFLKIEAILKFDSEFKNNLFLVGISLNVTDIK